MRTLKQIGYPKVVAATVVVTVALLCLFAAASMLVLPPDSLKADPVYQKF